MIDDAFEQKMRALGAVGAQHGVDGLQPLLRFLGIDIVARAASNGSGRALAIEHRTHYARRRLRAMK